MNTQNLPSLGAGFVNVSVECLLVVKKAAQISTMESKLPVEIREESLDRRVEVVEQLVNPHCEFENKFPSTY